MSTFSSINSGLSNIGGFYLTIGMIISVIVVILLSIVLMFFLLKYRKGYKKASGIIDSINCNPSHYDLNLKRQIETGSMNIKFSYNNNNYNGNVSINSKCNSYIKNQKINILFDPNNPTGTIDINPNLKSVISLTLIVFILIFSAKGLYDYFARKNKTIRTVTGGIESINLLKNIF